MDRDNAPEGKLSANFKLSQLITNVILFNVLAHHLDVNTNCLVKVFFRCLICVPWSNKMIQSFVDQSHIIQRLSKT